LSASYLKTAGRDGAMEEGRRQRPKGVKYGEGLHTGSCIFVVGLLLKIIETVSGGEGLWEVGIGLCSRK